MSNVLLCFLGTGKYDPVHYTIDGEKTEQAEAYVQAALVQLLQVPDMCVRVLVTEEAKTAHWAPFANRMRELGFEGERCKDIPIEAPNSETSLWELFEAVLKNIGNSDRVWLDITHGFRALPVISVLAMAFARNAKNFTFEGLLYGAYEARDNENIAPVFDLTQMMALPAWSESLAEWKRTGRADGLVQQTAPYLGRVQKLNKQATALTGLPKALQQVSDALTLVRHDAPGELAEEAVNRIMAAETELPSHASMKPLELILGPLKQDLEELSGPPTCVSIAGEEKAVIIDDAYLRRLVKTGKWFLDRKRLPEASTILRETITACAVRLVLTAGVEAVEVADKRYGWHHEKYRSTVDWGLQALSGAERMPETFNKDAPQNAAISKSLENDKLKSAARSALENLRQSRNKINHAWTSGEHTKEKFNASLAPKFLQGLNKAAVAVEELVELTIAATKHSEQQA